jgi:LacI family transcriptional regulator
VPSGTALAEASRLGYRPNRAASTLVTRKSRIIGVVLPDITNAVFPPILLGIEEGFAQAWLRLAIVANVGADEEEQLFVINRLLGQQVDGLILATARRDDPVIQMCIDQNVPVVTVNRSDETGVASCVVSDDVVACAWPSNTCWRWATGTSPTSRGRKTCRRATCAAWASWPPSSASELDPSHAFVFEKQRLFARMRQGGPAGTAAPVAADDGRGGRQRPGGHRLLRCHPRTGIKLP